MSIRSSLGDFVNPVIARVPRAQLRDTLQGAFSEERTSVRTIEDCFRLLPSARWSTDLRCTFASSWKATHLKMLAIYGLSCRMQRAAGGAAEPKRSSLYLAAAQNAATSYEDLGLDFDGQTHADLYDAFAGALAGGDSWQLPKYRLPEAHGFSRWVYRNMVVEPIADGLLTNMFSEIYNHGEYSIALPEANAYFKQNTQLTEQERRGAVTYISAHVEAEVEADHFMVVVEALDHYLAATGAEFDAAHAGKLFASYLRNLAPVMRHLTALMQAELAGQPVGAAAAGGGQLE
jgi:hypothetical protein